MQKCSNLSGFLANSIGAPHGEEDSCIAPVSNNFSNYFLISNYSWGMCLYMDFCMGLAPSSRGISCISPSFLLGGARVGSVSGNTSQYLHNTICNNVLYFSSIFSKHGIAPSRRSLSPYKICYKNRMGLPDVFNCLLYIILEPLIVPSGNLYLTSIMLAGRLFWIHVICTKSVTLIISLMYIWGASRRWNRFCWCPPSAVVCSKTYAYLWLFSYV